MTLSIHHNQQQKPTHPWLKKFYVYTYDDIEFGIIKFSLVSIYEIFMSYEFFIFLETGGDGKFDFGQKKNKK